MLGHTTDQQDYERNILQTNSHNHILQDYEGQAIKRYVKVNISQLTLWRLDYALWVEKRTKTRTDVMLITRRDDNAFYVDDNGRFAYRDMDFHYNDNVIELYDEEDVAFFENRNRVAIENNTIIEYDDTVEYIYAIVGYSDDGNQRPIYRLQERMKPLDREFKPAKMRG